jgi:hypothetical protein
LEETSCSTPQSFCAGRLCSVVSDVESQRAEEGRVQIDRHHRLRSRQRGRPRGRAVTALIGAAWLVPGGFCLADRTVVRNARLVPLREQDAAPDSSPLTVIIEDGVISAVRPGVPDDLRAGDVLVEAGGRWVMPGRIEPFEGDSVAALGRLPLRGVTTVVGPFSATELRWLQFVAPRSAFDVPDLVARPAPARPGPPPAQDSPLELRRGWLRSITTDVAAAAGLADRGSIAVGQRGDLLVLADDPLRLFATVDAPWQVVLNGKALRIGELAGAREFQAEVAAEVASWPPPVPAAIVFEIESAGLPVGRLELGPGPHTSDERWASPVGERTRSVVWFGPEREPLDVNGPLEPPLERSPPPGPAPLWTGSVRFESTGGPASTLEMTAEPPAWHRGFPWGRTVARARAAVGNGRSEDAWFLAPVAAPILNPMLGGAMWSGRLTALAPGEALTFLGLEPTTVPSGIRVGTRRLSIRRLGEGEGPLPTMPGDRLFRLESELGSPLGWLTIDGEGQPRRAALLAPEGITEYRRVAADPNRNPTPASLP